MIFKILSYYCDRYMGLSKTDAFSEKQNQISTLANALGHPARIAILEALAERQSCVCGDLVDVLPLAQATVSQHLKVLKNARLIRGEISGPKTCYCIDSSEWAQAKVILESFFESAINKSKDSCC